MGSSLRIGIDVHSIGSKKGGNETYYRELVRGLDTVPCNHQFILYYTNPIAPPPSSQNADSSRYSAFVRRRALCEFHWGFPGACGKISSTFFMRNTLSRRFQVVRPWFRSSTWPTNAILQFFHPMEGRALRALTRWSAKRADRIVTVSHFSKRDLIEIYGVKPENITVVYLAASEEFRSDGERVLPRICRQALWAGLALHLVRRTITGAKKSGKAGGSLFPVASKRASRKSWY